VGFSRQLNAAITGGKQATQHFNGGGFTGSVPSQESVNVSIAKRYIDVVYRYKRAKVFLEVAGCNSNTALFLGGTIARKGEVGGR